MADKFLSFKAQDIPQITTITVTGVWAGGDTATVTCNNKNVKVTIDASAVATTDVAQLLAWAINSPDPADPDIRTGNPPNAGTKNIGGRQYGEFHDFFARADGSDVVLQSTTDGVPFTVTVSETTAGSGSLGSPAATQAATGKNWLNEATNYESGTLPVAGDEVVFRDSDVPIKYGLDGLAVDVARFRKEATYTADIGLPPTNTTHAGFPYQEYRVRRCKANRSVGTQAFFDLGSPEDTSQQAKGRAWIEFDAFTSTTVKVYDAPSRTEDQMPGVDIIGGNGHSLTLRRGAVDLGVDLSGANCSISQISVGHKTDRLNDSDLYIGEGSAFDASSPVVTQIGGRVRQRNLVGPNEPSLWILEGGILFIETSLEPITLTIRDGGIAYPVELHRPATVNVLAGGLYSALFATGVTSGTSTVNVYRGAAIYDPNGIISKSPNSLVFQGTYPSDPENNLLLETNLTATIT